MKSIVSRPCVKSLPTRRSVACYAASAVEKVKLTAATIALSAGLIASPAIAGVKLNLANSAVVESPVHLEFTVEGLTVKPAAEGLIEGTGHFHVLIDEKAPAEGDAIPFDDSHKHYGKGQIADDIALTSGKHTLTLQFANAQHLSYGSKFAQTITVNVK